MSPRLQSVCVLCWLFLLFGNDKMSSATPSNLMDIDGNLFSSSCYKSIKPILTYIEELKERAERNAEKHLGRDKENIQLRQRLLDLSDFREQFKALNQQIEELRKTNIEKTEEDIKLKVKDLNECVANRDSLKKEIELERKSKIEMEEKFRAELDNLKKERDSLINEFEAKSIKESSNYKTKEEILNNEIQELKSQVSSCKKQLEETQNQLTNKNVLAESNSLKIKTIEKDLGECSERLPKTGCKGLPSGIHRIGLPGLDLFTAFCNGDIDGGGWIVMQKRFDGSEDFYRNWTEYREGFGKLGGEFFLGLESLHRITNSKRYELYIEIEDFNGRVEFARYDNFRIGNENEKYELQSIGEFTGSAGNALWWHIGGMFSTYDQDNDVDDDEHMAKVYHCGWWFDLYIGPNLNGRYYKSRVEKEDSMSWDTFESLKSVKMLIRPIQLK